MINRPRSGDFKKKGPLCKREPLGWTKRLAMPHHEPLQVPTVALSRLLRS